MITIGGLRERYRSGETTPAEVIEEIYSRIRSEGERPVWISLAGEKQAIERAGAVEAIVGMALYVLANMVVLSAFVMWYATALNRLDARQTRAEEHLERERTLLRALLDALPLVIFTKDTAGRFGLSASVALATGGSATEAWSNAPLAHGPASAVSSEASAVASSSSSSPGRSGWTS